MERLIHAYRFACICFGFYHPRVFWGSYALANGFRTVNGELLLLHPTSCGLGGVRGAGADFGAVGTTRKNVLTWCESVHFSS